MTENQWTSDSMPAPRDPGIDTIGTAPAASASGSRKETAKEEASSVASEAASAAQGVAQTARSEAANVAAEAKNSAQDLLHQARQGLSSQAGTQQQKAADGIRTISSQLQSMAEAPDQQGFASDLIRQAAQRSESVASWLENKQPGDLLGEVQRFARNRPGTFLLLAAGAGVLAGRLTRGLTAGAPESTSATGPGTSYQYQAAGRHVAAGGDKPSPGGPVTAPAAYGETIYGEPGRPGYSGTESGGVPLKDYDDPFDGQSGRL
ncbi:hypothetical protein ACLH0K_01080 [Arthrobacter sp. MPF02]|uniref:hypothetical protein n=1 Tax=Arthrobacter sp. MPF02 TaxID=3388492 RepID=UPI0039853A71